MNVQYNPNKSYTFFSVQGGTRYTIIPSGFRDKSLVIVEDAAFGSEIR